jgi:hypothetical protein
MNPPANKPPFGSTMSTSPSAAHSSMSSPLGMESPAYPSSNSLPSFPSDGPAPDGDSALSRAASAVSGAASAVSEQAGRVASGIREKSQQVAKEASHLAHEVKDTMVRHPMASAVTTIGLGLVIGYAFYEMLKPRPTPAQRALSLLGDIRESLGEFGSASADYAKDATRSGTKAMRRGMGAVADSRIAHQLRDLFA